MQTTDRRRGRNLLIVDNTVMVVTALASVADHFNGFLITISVICVLLNIPILLGIRPASEPARGRLE